MFQTTHHDIYHRKGEGDGGGREIKRAREGEREGGRERERGREGGKKSMHI